MGVVFIGVYINCMAIVKKIVAHKIAVSILAVVLIGGGYYYYKRSTATNAPPRYVTAAVTKGSLIVSISGSGQVAASNQVEIKPRASGDITRLNVTEGQTVTRGTIIAELDRRDAQKAVRDAQATLESATVSLAKLKQPADQLSILQTQHALEQANESKTKSEADIIAEHEQGFTEVADTFLDLPTIMAGLQETLYGNSYGTGQSNMDYYVSALQDTTGVASKYQTDAVKRYTEARTQYDKNFLQYKATSRTATPATVEALITQTYNTCKTVSEAVKSINNFLQFYKDRLSDRNLKPPAIAETQITTLGTYTGKVDTHLTSLLNNTQSIQDARTAITNADRSISEKSESINKLKRGTDPLDIQSQELSIQQRTNTLVDAKEKLTDYTIRAPFDGVVVNLTARIGDAVFSSTVMATLMTKKKIAEISFNEVDIANIHPGDKATITFDAIEGLSVSGAVADITTLGTVTQGVVNYTATIGFDTQDERVKPGMSVSVSVITDTMLGVLLVPNSAIKAQGDIHVVEILDSSIGVTQGNDSIESAIPPRQQEVRVGLSNDTSTEIVSGLSEGDVIVTRTITASNISAASTAPSLFGTGGRAGGGATGGIRIPR